MKCQKCGKGELRQQVSIFADAPLECHNLSKKGIRAKDVQILGAGWPTAVIYCTNAECGLRLATDKK
jgi:hypothetical protein